MGNVGFGTYRISHRSNEHRKALVLALENGCRVIDTSANYTNGDSETLIGEVLIERPEFNPVLITKAGYIQGKTIETLQELAQISEAQEMFDELVDISSNLKHSIHPEFLSHQLTQSLTRLKKEKINYFLLHNPEYYFQQPDPTTPLSQSEYYQRIEKALLYLESEVNLGRIEAYGISSNNFVLPINDPNVTDLNKIIEIIKKNQLLHFKMIQFPFNLIEIGALEKLGDYGEHSLLELCQNNEILTVINRPLNAFSHEKLVRLATYESEYENLNDEEAFNVFNECLNLLRDKWIEGSDEITTASDFEETEIIIQLKKLWNTLPTPDAVDQVFNGHFFPFIARVWGRDLSQSEAEPFFKLNEYSQLYARKNLSLKALAFKKQAQDVGLLPESSSQPFSTMAIETYLDYGFDTVLVGMKKTEYVSQLKHLF